MLKANNIWISSFIVFIASACSLIIELVAGRIMAPYVGVSLYTWTSIIGVVLAGISVGNFLGGQIADRWGSRKTLGILLLLSGVFSLAILLSINLLDGIPFSLPLVPKILLLAAAMFFPPSCVLGMISPVVVKLTLENLSQTGNIVGKIYACSALGSIVGTFLTGFVLISLLGTRAIVFIVAIVLLVMALIFGNWLRAKVDVATLLVLIAVFALEGGYYFFYEEKSLASPYLRETNYYSIRVVETAMPDNTIRKELLLDHLVHSYSWVDDPTRLEYDYEQIYAQITRYVGNQHPDIKTLFIGGGGYTFPRYVEAKYPRSSIDVVEIDPGVTQTAYEQLGLRSDTKVRTFNEDARLYFDERNGSNAKYNLVLGDAFNDLSLPYHLTTYEFQEKVKRVLEPDGYYMVNVIDNYKTGEFLRAFLTTSKKSFKYVYLLGTDDPAQAGQSTYVVLSGNQPLDVEKWGALPYDPAYMDEPFAGWLMPQDMMEDYLQEGRAVVLTDDYAPIDNMMAPLFVERGD